METISEANVTSFDEANVIKHNLLLFGFAEVL